MGRRISQTVSGTVTGYLLDVQPSLWTVLAETTSGATTRYLHGPRGIHGQQDNTGNWNWTVQDALGSVRSMADAELAILESRQYAPYGGPFGESGTKQTSYGFAGEAYDESGLLHLRARYYDPDMGRFITPDPYLGMEMLPQTLNRYPYGVGNPVIYTDPSGEFCLPCVVVIAAVGLVITACGGKTQTPTSQPSNTPQPLPTYTPTPTSTPTQTPTPAASSSVHVSCNTWANVRTHPSFYGGVVTQYPPGTTLGNYEERFDSRGDRWVRIEPLGPDGSSLWVKRSNLVEGPNTAGCPSGPTPTPPPIVDQPPREWALAAPGCRTGEAPRCIAPSASDEDVIAFVLACEAGNDPRQATDIAHVIRSRIRAAHFPNTAIDVVKQSGAFECYGTGATAISPIPTPDRFRDLARALINNDPLPSSPSDPAIHYALFTYGYGPYPRPEDATSEVVLGNLCPLTSALTCNQLGGIYISHTQGDSDFLTVFFSDEPGFVNP